MSCDRTNYALLYVDTYYNSIGMLVCYIFYDDVAVLLVAFASCRPRVLFFEMMPANGLNWIITSVT